jgi:hypothetical protein
MPATAAPSTAPEEENPLQASLNKIAGGALSRDTGTSTGVISYDPTQSFRPTGDAINISASPGTGASTAETWSHEIALENLKKSQLEFEYQQQQNAIANALKQQEAARAAQAQTFSQGLQSAEAARSQAAAAQQAALAPVNLAAARQALATGAYDQMLKQAQARAAAAQTYQALGGYTLDEVQAMKAANAQQNQFYAGAPIGSAGAQQQYDAWMRAGAPAGQTYRPQQSSQVYDMYGRLVNNGIRQ